jgi:CNT family concentrative nucleoside transporter
VAMVNYGLGFAHTSLGAILGWAFSPFAWVMGVPWSEATSFGALLGTKISVNEFLAYIQLADVKAAGTMSPRSIVIATYALCGFANFSSIAIQIGGIGTIAPSRRADVARLGLKAMIGGALASWMTAAIAGVLTA